MALNEVIINYKVKKQLGISANSYCVFDVMYTIQCDPSSNGWCKKSLTDIAEITGLSKRGVHVIIEKGIESGLVEASPSNAQWRRTTALWHKATPHPSPNFFKPVLGYEKPSVKYTYLMLDKSNGYVKIGKSKKPGYREKTLQSQKPTIELLCKWPESLVSETSLHEKYSDKRVRGEWFSLTQQDVNEILELVN